MLPGEKDDEDEGGVLVGLGHGWFSSARGHRAICESVMPPSLDRDPVSGSETRDFLSRAHWVGQVAAESHCSPCDAHGDALLGLRADLAFPNNSAVIDDEQGGARSLADSYARGCPEVVLSLGRPGCSADSLEPRVPNAERHPSGAVGSFGLVTAPVTAPTRPPPDRCRHRSLSLALTGRGLGRGSQLGKPSTTSRSSLRDHEWSLPSAAQARRCPGP